MKVHVILLGKDGVEHGRGDLDYDLIAERSVVERNGHFYLYQSSGSPRLATFKEIDIPYRIMEF